MNIPPDEICYSEAVIGLDAAFEYSHDADADLWVERCISDLAQLWNYGDLYAVTEVTGNQSRTRLAYRCNGWRVSSGIDE